jgi:large subunit ribosomal protein L6
MSRLAKKPLEIPEKVEITVQKDRVEVKGPKGVLYTPIPVGISYEIKDDKVSVIRENDWASRKTNQGLAFSLLRNAVIGVVEGFQKELLIEGIGYKAALQGKKLVLSLGYSNDVEYQIPDDITVEVPQPNRIFVKGNDKQRVGQVAADIRRYRKPEVYKGKGIRYSDEIVRKKVGKAGI